MPGGRNAAHDRQMIAGLKDAQHRRLSTRRIGAHHSGQQVEARFINENQGATLAGGLFFNAGQVSVRQAAMRASSRWVARSIGFCGVQFKRLTRRDTCALWYRTPNSRLITAAIRPQVHTSPRKPYASAPWRSKSGSCCNSAAVNSGGRPVCGRAAKAFTPSRSTMCNHWLTAPLLTPNAVAIACERQPACFNSQARRRRASFQSWGRGCVLMPPYFLQPEKFSKFCNDL